MTQKSGSPEYMTGEEVLAGDVINCICSMMSVSAPQQVREALRHAEHEKDDHLLHLVVYEYLAPRGPADATSFVSHVAATTSLTEAFKRLKEIAPPAAGPVKGVGAEYGRGSVKSIEGVVGDNAVATRILRCIVLTNTTRDGGIVDRSQEGKASPVVYPLSLCQLNIHSVEVDQQLNSLKSLFQYISGSVPCHQLGSNLRSITEDIVGSMRLCYHFLKKVDVKEFVHTALLNVCSENPSADVPELIQLMDERNICLNMKEVLAVWEPCLSVLDVNFEVQSDNKSKSRNAVTYSLREIIDGVPCRVHSSQDTNSRVDEDGDLVSLTSEVAYWYAVEEWIDHICHQLRGREWRLLHYFLKGYGVVNYQENFERYKILAKTYGQHAEEALESLSNGNNKRSIETFLPEITRLIKRVFQLGVCPPKRRFHFLSCVARDILNEFVALLNTQDLLLIQSPETQLQRLGKMMEILVELGDRYREEGRDCGVPTNSTVGAHLPEHNVYFRKLLERMRKLKDFLNNHFSYHYALRRAFMEGLVEDGCAPSFCGQLADAYEHFVSGVTGLSCLWDVSPKGATKYNFVLEAYLQRLDHLDDRLAQYVGEALSKAQGMGGRTTYAPDAKRCTMPADVAATVGAGGLTCCNGNDHVGPVSQLYHVYARFRILLRDKVQAALADFRAALLEQIGCEINGLCEEYVGRRDLTHVVHDFVTRLEVTPHVGHILWEQSVKRRLKACVERRDEISENGWHQLLLLSTIENRWCLNEQLAKFFGVPLRNLVTMDLVEGSEVHGTAYALAFLSLVHSKSESSWSQDTRVLGAYQFISEKGTQSLEAAKLRLVLLRGEGAWRSEQCEQWDVESFCDNVAQQLQLHVEQWCESARQKFSSFDIMSDTMALKGPLLIVIHAKEGDDTNGSDRKSYLSGVHQSENNNNSRRNSNHHVIQPRRMIVPNTPRKVHELLRDFDTLDGVHSCGGSGMQIFDDLRQFFRCNEERLRLADSITELICAFEKDVGDDEELMARLLPDEYGRVYTCLVEGAGLQWSDDKSVMQFVHDLSSHVSEFCATASHMREAVACVESILNQLSDQNSVFTPRSVVEKVEELLEVVRQIAPDGKRKEWYLKYIQLRLDSALLRQFQARLGRWTAEFLSMAYDQRFLDPTVCTEEYGLRPLRVHMRVLYKSITLTVPMAYCHNHWLNVLNSSFSWIHAIPRLYDDLHGVAASLFPAVTSLDETVVQRAAVNGYGRLAERLSPQILGEPLAAIEKSIHDAFEVERQWRQGQRLLNLEVGVLQQHLGDDLGKWNKALREIRDLATTLMDYTQPMTLVGGIVIVASDAQRELGRKLDGLTQHITGRYRDVVWKHLEVCSRRLSEERTVIEKCDVINNVDDASLFICELPAIYSRLSDIEKRIGLLVPAEECLRHQGVSLSDSSLCVRKIKEEHRAYKDLIRRKVKAVELRRPFLRDNAKRKEDELRTHIDELDAALQNLDQQIQLKQQHGKNHLEGLAEAMQESFYDIQRQTVQLEKQQTRLAALCRALGMPPMSETKLQSVASKTGKLRLVVGHILQVYQQLNELGHVPFSDVHPEELHEKLTLLQEEVEKFPDGVREHAAYDELAKLINERLSARWIIHELSSSAMIPIVRSERHWNSLKIKLGAEWKLEQLTVGDIWYCEPTMHANSFHEVLDVARGEHRLEMKLEQIAASWNRFEFQTAMYKDQLILIRGWDTVFAQLSDDIDTLQGFHLSPYYAAPHITSGVAEWETRLNLLLKVLEALKGVQQRWMHLDGLFSSNEDIYKQLSSDGMHFDIITREFWNLMPYNSLYLGGKTANANLNSIVVKTHDFLEEKRLLPSLEWLDGQLVRVQRVLGRYLDTQRRLFPRFFYVGDDDLLEAIGYGGNPALVEKHLPKMFTALSRFLVENTRVGANGCYASVADGLHVVGFACQEGERVTMNRPVPMKGRTLHLTLSMIESSMVETLKQLTISAVESLSTVEEVTSEWIMSFPLQVVCLAFQVWWVRLQEKDFASWRSHQQQQQQQPRCERSHDERNPSSAVSRMVLLLDQLASAAASAGEAPALRRANEELATLAVYQRDVSRLMETRGIRSAEEFEWLRVMRLYMVCLDESVELDAGESSAEPVDERSTSLGSKKDCTALYCRMADASLVHGFEYLGWYRRLVQTPLTDRCYLAMTQALHNRLGGSPVGPAGTGKTETVKSLGAQLGRHVVVFNCADAFDYNAIGRILLGLCQVGAWGCFDEFNRLEERVLSAVAQQIRTIQGALRDSSCSITIAQQTVPLKKNVALFVTMNPDFADRSQLPGNLKHLFRTVTMVSPDRETIVEVMLFAQGFRTAEALSRKVVPLFDLCKEQLSRQSHYDFGLRALKSVLVAAGEAKHEDLKNSVDDVPASASSAPVVDSDEHVSGKECDLMLYSLVNSIIPRLVQEDVELFHSLLKDFFPGRTLFDASTGVLRSTIGEVCRETYYTPTPAWVEKICQLQRTSNAKSGLMLVGPSGTGKTSCWKTLLRVMAKLATRKEHSCMDSEKPVYQKKSHAGTFEAYAYVIDPKAMTKAELFGVFDPSTREWKDGVFTSVLRRIVKSSLECDCSQQKHWIIFDGDVDPQWVENLNSLLDDSKIYTLPNGERLSLPPSVRIVFEAHDLKFATPATVSRCGMVWFSQGTLPLPCLLGRHIEVFFRTPVVDRRGGKRTVGVCDDCEGMQLRLNGSHFAVYKISAAGERDLPESPRESPTPPGDVGGVTYDAGTQSPVANHSGDINEGDRHPPESLPRWGTVSLSHEDQDIFALQTLMATVWSPAFAKGGLLERAFEVIRTERYWGQGIMEHNDLQLLRGVQSLLFDGVWRVWHVREKWGVLPSERVTRSYAEKLLHHAVFWSFGASLSGKLRRKLVEDLGIQLLGYSKDLTLLDVEPEPLHGTWSVLRDKTQPVDLRPEDIGCSDVIIPTADAYRYKTLLEAWITGGDAVILCGPPGSGKTTLVASVLHNSSKYEAVFLNFSSATRPENVIRALEQYCTIQNRMSQGLVMTPANGKRLLLFCDEINLPAADQYGTQHVVQFLRQLIERSGYYRTHDNVWITLEGVQVIGACNPPTDNGRVSLSHRFLRWAPVLFVEFPTEESLHIIYTAYCRAVLSFDHQFQKKHAKPLAMAMVDVYTAVQAHFSVWQQPQYVFSPRELSQWIRALHGALQGWSDHHRSSLTVENLIHLVVHEGLRIFHDRLVQDEEREWTIHKIGECLAIRFPDVQQNALRQPKIFSAILDGVYMERTREEVSQYIEGKVRTFCEEEFDAELVVFDTMIDHVIRVDRVLRQPSGHMLLAGASGVGKTVTTRLVAWINNMSIFQINMTKDYQLSDYERDLREVLRRAGCGMERICFIFDDSDAVEPGFLEYINALLPTGEIPGLFDGDKWGKLMDDIRACVETQVLSSRGCATKGFSQHRQWWDENDEVLGSGGSFLTDNSAVKGHRSFSNAMGDLRSNVNYRSITGLEVVAPLTLPDYIDLTSEQQLYRWFVSNVRQNLHVVFVTDPSSKEFSERVVTSPALFNRCTIDWFGEWDRITRNQLASRLLKNVDVMFSCNVELGGTEIGSREVLMEALSDIHEATQEVNRVVKLRSAHRGTFITPRHFSSLLQHLRLLYEEKKGKSIEQLTHLRSGLAKLVETSLEVESKQTRLREHEVALAEKTSKAQQILECIVSDTGKTEREKREAERLRQQLQDEEELIIADRGKVEQQLSEAAPALKEAEEGLNTIKPEYLREIRAYTTPPVMVKRVLETVLAVMGERRAGEWDVIKLHIRRDDFIAGVKAFQPREISDEAVQMVCGMLNEDGFTYEAAMRASKAAGPLLQWVNAQINYAVVYRAVQPLRLRIEQIVIAQGIKRQHLEQTEGKISALEESLQRYKQDYQLTTEEIANYKATMGTVAARCERACKLLQQLLEERERWEAEVSGFDSEIGALLGDCLLAAASLTYFGYFDEPTRQSLLLPLWRKRLEKSQIRFREKVSADMVDYLVTPSQRLGWELQGLPKDNLYVENAVILHRNRRFPLLIDPTGVATAFLHKMHAGGSMRTTSFTKNGYLKQLDMAIRFGYPLLIEDAEFMDPVVGPLLNNEVRRVGGCVLTRLGGQDIEISPSFRLFLVTRDSNYQPSPGIAGKACIINFTVTQSSLESQCRHQVLLHERAEVDKQRTHVLKMRGEYFLRIRTLEQELLTLIAGSEGSILENSALTVALEQLKEESEVLKRGIVESEESMRAVAAVEAHYQPLSTAVAKVYFVLRRFSQFHGLYQFGVKFIFSVVKDALAMLPPRENHEDVQKKGTTDQGEGEEKYDDDENENAMRLQVLTRYVFNLFYRRARRGMFSQDHLVLATMLGRIRSGIDDSVGRQVTPDEWDLFENALVGPIESAAVHKEGETRVDAGKSGDLPKILAEGRVCLPSSIPVLGELLRLPLFCQVQESLNNPDHAEAWGKYFLSAEPHTEVMPAFARNDYRDSPTDTDIHGDNTTGSNTNAVGPTRCALIAALLLLHTRRDTFVPAAFEFVRRFFDGAGADTCTVDSRAARDAAESEMGATKKYSEGEGVTAGSGESFFTSAVHDLYVIQRELSNSTPLILVANAGSDPTVSLEDVANAMNVQLHVAVMGCADSTEAAEHFLSTAVVDGSWVLLKNMHLARPFADVVEKRLHRDLMRNQLHGNFRLIMSIEAKARQSTHDSSGSVKIDGMQYKGSLLQLPVSLVESSVVVVYEPPPGLKASLTQTFSTFMSLPGQISHSPDVLRIYLAAAWFHAIVMERLRYVPLGWSTRYDISDTEFWHMLQVINSWVASNNNNDNNNNNIKVVTGADDKLLDTSPIVRDRVPWAALQTIIGTALYGGKISNDFDQFLLDSLCEQLFSPDIFDDSKFFAVLGGSTSDERPSFRAINSLREVQAWLTTLPEARSLMWARLPTSASRLMLAEEAVSTFERLAFLRFVGEMEWVDYRLFDDINEHHAESTSLQAPVELQWARKVRQFCSAWRVSLERLDPMEHARAPHPGEVPLLSGGKKLGWHTEDPISVVIFREYTFAVGRLREVMDDLQAVENICCGGSKPTPEQRVLIDCLLRDQVPPPWARSYTSYATTADQWLTDFKSRVAHIVYLCGALQRESYGFTCFNLGLFFWPEAFITTTKQQASRKQNQPLERLQIELQLQTDEEVRAHATKTIGDDDVWHVVGLTLVSASLEECETGDGDSRVNKCVLRTADATALSTPVGALVRWKVADTGVTSRARIPCRTPVSAKYPSPVNSASQDSKVCWIKVPLYASAKRNAILHVVELMVDIEKTPLHTWYEQGICLVAWSMDLH